MSSTSSSTITRHAFTTSLDGATGEKTTSYLSAGPVEAPLLIFIHGWPDLALLWKSQISYFARLGFRIVAPDTRGYGESSGSRDEIDYSLRSLVKDCLDLLQHLDAKQAVWIGHDWGCGIVWAFAAHHPEACLGVVGVTVPYRTIELGLDALISLVNRDLYPADEYPAGQWDYQVYYEKHQHLSSDWFDAHSDKFLKLVHFRGDPPTPGQKAFTSTLTRDGGWLGGKSGDEVPDLPLEATLLSEELFAAESESMKRHGWFGATSYYLNHDVNRVYSMEAANGSVLEMPVLFVDATYDLVCTTAGKGNKMGGPMKEFCKNLTMSYIDAGHWVELEKPSELSKAVESWLRANIEAHWPTKV